MNLLARLTDNEVIELIELHAEIRQVAASLGLSQLVISANGEKSASCSRLEGENEHLDIDITKSGERVCLEYALDGQPTS